MNKTTAFTALLFTLAVSQVNMSWADVAKPLGKLASECGPVFASVSDINQLHYSERLRYSDKKASVIREYFAAQRRTLTFKSIAQELHGHDFKTIALTEQTPLVDGCFSAFSKATKEPGWNELALKVDANTIDQVIEDSIFEHAPAGYRRVMEASKRFRSAMPFKMGALTARRIVFDPPSLILFAEAPAGLVADGLPFDAATPFCSALSSMNFDKALYPLIKVRALEGNGDQTLATASGSQCHS